MADPHPRQWNWLRSGWVRPLQHCWQRPWIRRSLIFAGCCLSIRLLPYLAPIRAQDLQQNQQAVTFQDRQGLLLGTILTRDQEHTVAVPLSQISPAFLQAIVAAEDGRFYQHGPLDLQALARASRDNLQAGQVVSGASTITMQLARMVQPVPPHLGGKLQEVWMAWRLAAGMNHDQILAAYVNRLPMGGNIYGVEAAAQIYFGVSAQDLTLAQATLLAALPNAPNALNPHNNWDGLKRRQLYVLNQMVKDGYLTVAQARQVAAEPVSLQTRQQGIQAAPHFLFWLAPQLPPQYPATLRTSIDLSLQQFVEAQVQQTVASLRQHQGKQAAAIVIENRTGQVLAYVGSPDYFSRGVPNQYDGVQALRQPGSTLKPFLFQLALENRTIRPTTILADVPTHYAIPGAQLYSPQDYNERYHGPVRVRLALGNSLNIPAVRVLEQIGVGNFLKRLRELGFSHLNRSPEYYGLGLTLGSGEVSLWELASAYLLMARQGQQAPLQVFAPDSPVQLASLPSPASPASHPIGDANTWALITDILSDPHARARAFGVDSVLQLPFSAAVKTGTSSNYRDTWTVGFSRDYTVATWVGNFNGAPMRNISGVTGAAPLWQRIMLHLHQNQEPAGFAPPANMVRRPICALSGYKPNPACPTVVQEYIPMTELSNYDRQADPVFQLVNNGSGRQQYRLHLPPEYNQWLVNQPNLWAMANVATAPRAASPQQSVSADYPLRIAFPQNGDYFLWYEPRAAVGAAPKSNDDQKLKLQLTHAPQHPVRWRLNGKLLSEQTAASLFWRLQPGHWTLQVESGGKVDQVSFEVQSATTGTGSGRGGGRRGFSVVGTEDNAGQ
jgi:penicillin-binding protein 1C